MTIPVLLCLFTAVFLLALSLPALIRRKLHIGVTFPAAAALLLFLYTGASLCLIRENELNERIVIATDYFHQFRASLLAEDSHLPSCGMPSVCELSLIPGFWLREIPGIFSVLLTRIWRKRRRSS